MALFYVADCITLCCSNLEKAKQFLIAAFECKPTKVPADWDDPLPSDVALKLPADDEPRGLRPGPIQDGGGTEFFEVRDSEGNVIEICKEPWQKKVTVYTERFGEVRARSIS